MKLHIFTNGLLLLTLKTCVCMDQQYLACVSKTCGNNNISYPFYIESQQEAYCGEPGFNLSCNTRNQTILELFDSDYLVLDIFYHNLSLRVSNVVFFDDDNKCPFPIENLTLYSSHRFSWYTTDLTYMLFFYSNCNLSESMPTSYYEVQGCPSTTLAILENDLDKIGLESGNCSAEAVKVPVELYGDEIGDQDEDMWGKYYKDVARRGFVLNYTSNNCSVCSQSGGRCGYDSDWSQFLCFCTDKPQLANCKSNKKLLNKKVVISITVIIASLAFGLVTYFAWRWMTKNRDKDIISNEVVFFNIGDAYPNFPDNNMFGKDINEELLVFSLATLTVATNNFDVANKLGQGGFGPVYKGKLADGQDIAVKRLSSASGQGLEEFMNEVVVISKLQHRNLVRIFGCCIERDEKMLVYEYMPNKSLDAFLFDDLKREHLHWRKRFEIIEGIGRGLLYLHRDSRLKIIHRDLKASNILLDEKLNPKISDFGMARIFVTNQDQANTNRVVGTYGYMSPEYAMEGRFSEKSDVFSYGVLLLEIVTGRRNTSFYHDEHSTSLLGAVWKSWNDSNARELIDPMILSFEEEIMRCIHVGLLCVQEHANDRPTMSTVLSMLSSEILHLPTSKQPAFIERQIGGSFHNNRNSINNVTVTVIQGR